MSAMPSTIQADFPAGSLPIRGTLNQSTLNPGDLEDDPFAGPSQHQPDRVSRKSSLAGLLIMFCAGVALTAAWYSFGGPIREAIAGLSPQLAWMASQPAAVTQPAADPATPAAPAVDLSAALPDIDAVRQNVDRIATTQDKIIKSIDQLSAGQEQLTKEIAKLQAVEQYILYKNSEPPAPAARSAPATASVRRPAAPTPLNPSPAPQAAPAH
jgi:hypothetical protein